MRTLILFDQRYGFGEVRARTAHVRMLNRLQTCLRVTQILQYVLMVRTIGIVEHGGCEVQVDQRRLDDIAVRTCHSHLNEIRMCPMKPAYCEPEQPQRPHTNPFMHTPDIQSSAPITLDAFEDIVAASGPAARRAYELRKVAADNL